MERFRCLSDHIAGKWWSQDTKSGHSNFKTHDCVNTLKLKTTRNILLNKVFITHYREGNVDVSI